MTTEPVGYLDPLRVEAVDRKTWALLSRFRWRGSEGDVFEVEAGEETDFATVPWWTQSLIPRTGTWTKAAVIHDKMCRELFRIHRERLEAWRGDSGMTWAEICELIKPVFTSTDADLIFRKNARDEGTGPIRAELLWFGVRAGALVNPARREGWFAPSQSLRFLLDTVLVVVATLTLVVGLSLVWPW